MTRLEQLESEIRQLPAEEFAQLREWLLEEDWRQWDEQIAGDAEAGKLESLFARAVEDHLAGKSKKF